MYHTEAITCPPQIITNVVEKKRMGYKKDKGITMSCGWWNGTSQDEVMLIGEEIKVMLVWKHSLVSNCKWMYRWVSVCVSD